MRSPVTYGHVLFLYMLLNVQQQGNHNHWLHVQSLVTSRTNHTTEGVVCMKVNRAARQLIHWGRGQTLIRAHLNSLRVLAPGVTVSHCGTLGVAAGGGSLRITGGSLGP